MIEKRQIVRESVVVMSVEIPKRAIVLNFISAGLYAELWVEIHQLLSRVHRVKAHSDEWERMTFYFCAVFNRMWVLKKSFKDVDKEFQPRSICCRSAKYERMQNSSQK